MKHPLRLALLISVVLGDGPSDASLKALMENAAQIQDTLNFFLQTNMAAPGSVTSYIAGADSHIDNSITTVSNAISNGATKFTVNSLLEPLLRSVTSGAQVLVSSIDEGQISGNHINVDPTWLSLLVTDYTKLSDLGAQSHLDVLQLQKITRQLSKLASSGSLHARDDSSGGLIQAAKDAITNMKQTVDTLREQLEQHDGHAGKDAVNAAITGLDSQIDNVAALVSKSLNGVTLGVSGEIGDFLLGPFFQATTNGAEVIISNVIGGSVDIVTDGTAKLFSQALSQLLSVGQNFDVSKSSLQNLAKVQKEVEALSGGSGSSGVAGTASHGSKSRRSAGLRAVIQDLKDSVSETIGIANDARQKLGAVSGSDAQAVVNMAIDGLSTSIQKLSGLVSGKSASADSAFSETDSKLDSELSSKVSNLLMAPLFDTVAHSAEAIVSRVVGSSMDIVSSGTSEVLAKALSILLSVGQKLNVASGNMQALERVQKQVVNLKAPSSAKTGKNKKDSQKRAANGAARDL